MTNIIQYRAAIDKKLVNSRHKLSASELHVIYCALAGIDQKKELEEDTMHSVTLTNYAKVRGSSRQHAKEALIAAGRGLRRSPLTIVEGNGSFIELSWLITIRYDEEEEKLELQWHPKILPYISDLRDYCSLALAVVGRIKGQYSLRLYERIRLQCKYSQKPGKIYLPLNEFRWELGLSDEYYKEFKYLKRDLLVPAIRELKKHHAVYTDIQPVREGRLTTGIWLYYMFLTEEEWGMYENGAVVDVIDIVDGKLKKVSNGQGGSGNRSFIRG